MSKYIGLDSDLLLLAAEDSKHSREEAAERIRAMTPKERRDLRAACQRATAHKPEHQPTAEAIGQCLQVNPTASPFPLKGDSQCKDAVSAGA